jgi:hypothetical protein
MCMCAAAAEDIDGGASPSTSMLSEAAKAHGVTLVGGSVPERSEGRLYNTCCVYDNTGRLLAKHRWGQRHGRVAIGTCRGQRGSKLCFAVYGDSI